MARKRVSKKALKEAFLKRKKMARTVAGGLLVAAAGLKGINWYNDKKHQQDKEMKDRELRMWSFNNTKKLAEEFRNPKNKEGMLAINKERLSRMRKKYKGL